MNSIGPHRPRCDVLRTGGGHIGPEARGSRTHNGQVVQRRAATDHTLQIDITGAGIQRQDASAVHRPGDRDVACAGTGVEDRGCLQEQIAREQDVRAVGRMRAVGLDGGRGHRLYAGGCDIGAEACRRRAIHHQARQRCGIADRGLEIQRTAGLQAEVKGTVDRAGHRQVGARHQGIGAGERHGAVV